MTAFRRFDPYAVLAGDNPERSTLAGLAGLAGAPAEIENRAPTPAIESRDLEETPAKVAKPAKVEGSEAETLATLAASTPEIECPPCRPEAEMETRPATLITPIQWHVGGAFAADEPPYDEPYSARRGAIRSPTGRFEHFCSVCGAWGSFGYGATGKQLGRWYCFAHRPDSEP